MAKVLGQTTPLKIMSGIYKSGRLHHAYLFYGDEGIGKFESALNYAKAILCERNNGTYCDECKSCKMIDQYKHPDVIVAGTDERFRNAELYFNQYLEYKLPHLFNNFYTSCRSILYKAESMLLKRHEPSFFSFRWQRIRIFAKFAGSHSAEALEKSCKIRAVVNSDPIGDIGNGQRGIVQQPTGFPNPQFLNILQRGKGICHIPVSEE